MREKQRRADLRNQGIDPDAVEAPVKTYDTSFMNQYEVSADLEEEKTEEQPAAESNPGSAAAAGNNQQQPRGKKGKKAKKGK